VKTSVALSCLALFVCPAIGRCQGPSIEDVVANPADYAGQKVVFPGVLLSGSIYRYDVAGVRKYYLTAGTPDRVYEAGFFLAPPALADKLYDTMNPRLNYNVTLTCRVERITINTVAQWHGIVTAVSFIDSDGQVLKTVKVGK
jgi:hypothetical protein